MKIETADLWKRLPVRHFVAMAAMLSAGLSVAGGIVDTGWMERSLFSPSPWQLESERRGHITIYQGLTDVTVERAMAKQFGRIEHMMFVGTIVTDEDGEPSINTASGKVDVEDDGCED